MNTLTLEQQKNIRKKIDIESGNSIILLDVSGRKDISVEESNANIYRVNNKFEVMWSVNTFEKLAHRDSFVSILLKDGRLLTKRFFGKEYEIDLITGVAEEVGWDK